MKEQKEYADFWYISPYTRLWPRSVAPHTVVEELRMTSVMAAAILVKTWTQATPEATAVC